MQVVEDIREMQRWGKKQQREGRRVALVPTMGFLHKAHLELVREGRKRADAVVVSIFVNPVQFGPGEDFATYPRDVERDGRLLAEEGIDVLFHPETEDVYPAGYQTSVDVKDLSRFLCGPHRPGHFQGVATVVTKLFNMVRPQVAVFGLKDYQQFLVIRRLVKDLNFDIELIGYPIVREADGLAMSSRNSYLNEAERKAALCLSRALKTAQDLVRQGEFQGERILQEVRAEIAREPLARPEYLELCDAESLEAAETIRGRTLLALAVRVGRARLIDNSLLEA